MMSEIPIILKVEDSQKPYFTKIELQTSKSRSIANNQGGVPDTILFNKQINDLKTKFPGVLLKTNPSNVYNCHGMTFACRRTGIDDAKEIVAILKDDNYNEVSETGKVQPGDIVIYYSAGTGDIEHSGIVLQIDDFLKNHTILSKWGMACEAIHPVKVCPYDLTNIRYYRCML